MINLLVCILCIFFSQIITPNCEKELPNFFTESSTTTTTEKKDIEIIIVHGTFAANFDWYQEGGDFYEAVLLTAKKEFCCPVTILPFKWTGYLGCLSRIEASTKLAEHIIASDKKTYTIGHSHGGNIINLATQILALSIENIDPKEKVQKIENMTSKLFEKEKEYFTSEETRQVQEKLSSKEEITEALTRSIKTISENLISRAMITTGHDPKFLIETNFLLATPVDPVDLSPSESIVKQSFNLFSKNDMVQPLFGLYSRTYGQNRKIITDASVIFQTTDKITNKPLFDYPGHTDMHSEDIGKILFLIPKVCNDTSDEIYQAQNKVFNLIIRKDSESVVLPEIKDNIIFNSSNIEMWLDNIHDLTTWFI